MAFFPYTASVVQLNTPTCTEICNDGLDNDGDGLIDCDDPECGFNSVEFSSTPVNCANGGTIDLNVIEHL